MATTVEGHARAVLVRAAAVLEASDPTLARAVRRVGAELLTTEPPPDHTCLQLFGRVAVADATPSRALTGRPAEVVSLVALTDVPPRVEHVCETLWPDTDPRRGRERLRTVLARTRRRAGPIVVRRSGALELADHVRVDVREFDRLAADALRATGRTAEDHARAALDLHAPRLAPGVTEHPWLAAEREHRRRRALALHDLLADTAEHAGRDRDAAGALGRALALDPTGDHRAVRAARLLAGAGGREEALGVLQRARCHLARLDLDTTAVDRVAAGIRRRAGEDPGLH